MELKEGGIYSNGKKIWRKILRFDGDRVVFAKCYLTNNRGMYVIGGGTHLTTKILKSSFRNWVRNGIDNWDNVNCSRCCVVLTGDEGNSTQLCKECYGI
ncbi:hypothetical protein [Paenibacillus oryzisoli]|uniref:Uncharacterized protein n=1 Tax=Paenibacillus oryzisoli TaxID=1850517 RepID=A0A198ADV1_9BACL|nr:hypothetical protein [Paenibacillus oryzisoli]OAS19265.1 hypothetical protein A8708_26510 [Paenibacillus oryzisoli]